jgi:hypothetical protein
MNATHVRADHTLRFGTDARRHSRTGFLPGASQGLYTFDTTYTRRYSDTAPYTPGDLGLSWAAFMLGIPTVSTLNTPVDYATSSPYYSAFVQEAWRATPKLTLNLGLRFELERGMTETDDRMIASFDPDFVPAFAEQVIAAYARNPIPEVSVSAFRENLRGGAIYAGQDGSSRRGWKTQSMWLPPCLGRINQRPMVVRADTACYDAECHRHHAEPAGFSTVASVPSTTTSARRGCRAIETRRVAAGRSISRANRWHRFVTPVGASRAASSRDSRDRSNMDHEHPECAWRLGAERLGRNIAIG